MHVISKYLRNDNGKREIIHQVLIISGFLGVQSIFQSNFKYFRSELIEKKLKKYTQALSHFRYEKLRVSAGIY